MTWLAFALRPPADRALAQRLADTWASIQSGEFLSRMKDRKIDTANYEAAHITVRLAEADVTALQVQVKAAEVRRITAQNHLRVHMLALMDEEDRWEAASRVKKA